ncbi:Nif11-like leader peptide family natural product precursor [Laspinema olomoucense]|uniref:Nif11-like leader peptide family natural product n=1 Tax=Laspinema olomoucense D3b TaxID=2953688 RepID=A0ABT2NDV1_9CYAN|nr:MULTISPECIES: Nif11-like leader peptide family natural product precursor [unclassified Laspinema]MCT7980732.1 Nif11-like leader peptide family natural product precursor [Laspinema sp. D3b]MCT7988599.1 Nif11-like leader peptide family natural product precursor [Laspinema sp. D3a]MCT7993873.1 Nif11-like leader peptide family natural product precursor [Laspinema sp. D3c]
MTQKNAAALFKAVKEDLALQQQMQAAKNPEAIRKLAQERGYSFTDEELNHEISQLSKEELSCMINPGIAPREHLIRR